MAELVWRDMIVDPSRQVPAELGSLAGEKRHVAQICLFDTYIKLHIRMAKGELDMRLPRGSGALARVLASAIVDALIAEGVADTTKKKAGQ